MKKIYPLLLLALVATACKRNLPESFSLKDGEKLIITKTELQDKIKGAWAGQTIGVTYGGPTEFRFNGTMIQDYVPIPWYDGVVTWWYDNAPGLYDDIYMDLTFVEVYDRLGLDAPADSFAMAFATAEYSLWHANQAARVNILEGIMPPESGHWLNNPHADCIDYQIEADFAGIMSPGMVNSASEISDKIGHIMNYGDGWYGGVYVGAMYALAFISDDIEFIVSEALKTIPEESQFYRCIRDVIALYEADPADWRSAWFEVEKKWSEDVGCPDGVLRPFNIDAKVNAAYIVIGLLYGEKDFSKTIDISTRCGQDSDCNPASAGGILGTMIGYERIPDYWKKELYPVEDIDFKYTTISLKKAYRMSFEQAVLNVIKNGGEATDDSVAIIYQEPVAVRFEKGFDRIYPVMRDRSQWSSEKEGNEFIREFEGTGFVIGGWVNSDDNNYVANCEVYIDDEMVSEINLPAKFTIRKPEFYWDYQLEKGKHEIRLKFLNPREGVDLQVNNFVVYSDQPYQPEFLK